MTVVSKDIVGKIAVTAAIPIETAIGVPRTSSSARTTSIMIND